MFHFQVVSMGTRLLLLCLIYQTVITESLGGVTLPFADVIGKVTPVKPKPSSPSTVSSSSLVCDSNDIISKLFSPASGTGEFSLPLAITSSSRALPVPKIDSLSIADVKLPERLGEDLSSKLCNAPIINADPVNDTPDVSLPFLSSSTNPPNAFSTYSSWDIYSCSSNKISSLSNIKSLPTVPVKPLKSIDTDVLCSTSESNNVLTQPSITRLSRSRTLDLPLTLETKNPSCSEQLDSNTFSPSTSCSSPLYYKSMYLPVVRTPSDMLPLIFTPISYKAADNIDFSSSSSSCNLLSPITFSSDTSLNLLSGINVPSLPIYITSIKTTEVPNPITIQLPSNTPILIEPVFSVQNAAAKNLWSPLEANSGSASVAFESTFEPTKLLSSPVFKDSDTIMLPSSMPYLLADKIPDVKLTPWNSLKIKPSAFGSPSNFLNSPETYLVPITPSSSIVDELPNRPSNFDSSKHTPVIFPIITACVESVEIINTNDPSSNFQTCVDSKNVPNLERINLSSPFAPKLATCQHALFTEECNTSPLNYSPPIIPLEPIPTISFGSSVFSPVTYFPSKISPTSSSISYINQSPSSSIAQSAANMVSAIKDLVSVIAQNIVSSYQYYIDSASQNILQRSTIQSNPYDNSEFLFKQTLPVLPLPQGNPMNTTSIIPFISVPIDCIQHPAVDTTINLSSDATYKSSAFEISSKQPLLIASPQPTETVLPPTSLITFSPPQLCPSFLPSPSLPADHAPVFKVSSSKKDSDLKKLIELVLLAEVLNNDESFDCEDLDALLAFLPVS